LISAIGGGNALRATRSLPATDGRLKGVNFERVAQVLDCGWAQATGARQIDSRCAGPALLHLLTATAPVG